MPHRNRPTSATCGQGFQKESVGRSSSRHREEAGKPLSELRQNMALGLKKGAYLYYGEQLDLVCKLAQEHEEVEVRRFRKGVAVLQPGVKLAKAHKQFLDGKLKEEDLQRQPSRSTDFLGGLA